MPQTIRDFLVSVNWDIKESDQRRLVGALEGATLKAKVLGDVIEDMARRASEAIANVAVAFDRLYFASQRTGATVATIKEFGYAVSQLGGSADAAQASLEAMGQKLRANPGNIVYLNALGFGIDKVTGKLGIQRDLLERFQKMPMPLAELYRQAAGEDERTFLATRDPSLLKFYDQQDEFQKRIGFDPAHAARDGNSFMTTWRRVAMQLDNIADDLLTKLMAALTGPFQEFQKFIDANGPAIGQAIDEVTQAIGEMTAAWVDDFEKIIKDPTSFQNFRDTLKSIADTVKTLSDHFHAFVTDLKWVNDGLNAGANVLNRLTGQPLVPDGSDQTGANPPGSIARALNPTAEDIVKGLNSPEANAPPSPQSLGGYVNRGWNWLKGKFGYGDHTSSADPAQNGDHVSATGPQGGSKNANFTKENAQAIIDAAKELGTTPEDLATVIGYETAGTYSPSKWGGAGGRYMGLIQFGPGERQQFGVSENQSFPDQMKSVVAYLKARGFKPGMGLKDLYSTINAGSPGHYGASDGYGTVATHVERMKGDTAAGARTFLSLADGGAGGNVPMTVTGETEKGRFINGQWFPWWAHPTAAYLAGTAGAGGPAPDASGWDKVQRDAAQGNANIAKWEAQGPWGSLDPHAFDRPLGGAGDINTTHNTSNQNVSITVDGANDPSIVAHMVASHLKRSPMDQVMTQAGATN